MNDVTLIGDTMAVMERLEWVCQRLLWGSKPIKFRLNDEQQFGFCCNKAVFVF